MSAASFVEKQKEESFLALQTVISQPAPFFIGRLSGNETRLCGHALSNTVISNDLFSNMLYGAGIQFKSKEDLIEYVKIYNKSVQHSTLLGVWDGGMYMQAKAYYDFTEKAMPAMKRICAHAVEPFYFMDHPEYMFDTLFENKKVLIITSHKKTTEAQIASGNVKKAFKKPIFHDTTQFAVYKPAQQNAGSHDQNSWKIHFETMKLDIVEIKKEFDFDIALVSAGGFGMILCDFIYTELNTSTMYVGGALQLFFGIRGKRWATSPYINDSWTEVDPQDKPANVGLCEGGCYW